jgi:hypothetical protein
VLCSRLNAGKTHRAAEILYSQYRSADIIFLQEVGEQFMQQQVFGSGSSLKKCFNGHVPSNRDKARDQASVILLRKQAWSDVKEVTEEVLTELHAAGKSGAVASGDIMAVIATRVNDGKNYLLLSFHGDTNGLSTLPVLQAAQEVVRKRPGTLPLFGMDANAYGTPSGNDELGAADLNAQAAGMGLLNCWGERGPHPLFNTTTNHARTPLQAQLNKAVNAKEKDKKGDRNPKDFLFYGKGQWVTHTVMRDNTGRRVFTSDVFPTLVFPSDHAILSAKLHAPNQ